MVKNRILIAALLLGALSLVAFSADKPAYSLFNGKGKRASYDAMIKAMAGADIVLFGEYHDNPIVHWLQLECTQDVFKLRKDMALGAEMFEADVQPVVDRYLYDSLPDKEFEKTSRPWPNYKTDYKPLLQFARDNKLPFIATNIPRKFASMVFRGGFSVLDTLTSLQKSWIAPLPPLYDSSLACYADMIKSMGMHGGPNLPKAQAIKDATMSHFIMKNWSKGKLFIHYNGAYHSNNYQSIYWYLKKANPALKIVTISTTMQPGLAKLDKEAMNTADFVIVTPESMTRTH
jgi:uncharacterized iron-regulated protein